MGSRQSRNENPPSPKRSGYALPSVSRVKLEVFNTLGQRVSLLVDEVQEPGYHSVQWDGTKASGIYFYRIEATGMDNPANYFVDVKRMVYLR